MGVGVDEVHGAKLVCAKAAALVQIFIFSRTVQISLHLATERITFAPLRFF